LDVSAEWSVASFAKIFSFRYCFGRFDIELIPVGGLAAACSCLLVWLTAGLL